MGCGQHSWQVLVLTACESRDVLRFSQVHGLFLGAEHVGRGSFLHRLQEVRVFQCSSGDLAGPEG